MKVLVIDDSSTMRDIQRSVLSQLDWDAILEASNGVEGLALVQSQHPDMVLVDRTMPGMDGLEFVRELRSVDRTTPVIVVACERERDFVVEAIKAGANNYVVKPFTPDLLSQRVQETLSAMEPAERRPSS